MMRRPVPVFLVILLILLLLPAAATVYLNIIDTREIVARYVESITGRKLTITGNLTVAWDLTPSIHVENLALANAPWSDLPNAMEADRVTVSLSPTALLKGEVKLTSLVLEGPRIWVEKDPESGRFNLDFKDGPPSNKGLPGWLGIDSIEIRRGKVTSYHATRHLIYDIEYARLESNTSRADTFVSASGSIQDTPVSITGSIASLKEILQAKESQVELHGTVGGPGNTVSVSGVVGNLLRWRDLDLWFDSQIGDFSTLSNLSGVELPPYRGITAHWKLVQPGKPNTLYLDSLNATLESHGLDIRVTGGVGRLAKLEEIALRLEANGVILNDRNQEWLDRLPKLEVEFDALVSGKLGKVALDIQHAEVSSTYFTCSAAGRIVNPFNNWQEPLGINCDSQDVMGLFPGMELHHMVPVELGISGGLQRRDGELDLQNVALSASSGSSWIDGGGSVRRLGSLYDAELEFGFEVQRDELKGVFTNPYLALFNRFLGNGTVSAKAGMVDVTNLEISGEGAGLALSSFGRIDSPFGTREIVMSGKLVLENLEDLEPAAGLSLPSTAGIEVIGELIGNTLDGYRLVDLEGGLSDDRLDLKLVGNIGDLFGLPRPEVKIHARLDNSGPIREIVEDRWKGSSRIPESLFPMVGDAVLGRDPLTGSLALDNIRIDSLSGKYKAVLTGKISILVPDQSLRNAHPKGRFSLEYEGSFDPLITGLGTGIPWLPSPDIIDVKGGVGILYAGGRASLEDIDLDFTSDGSRIHMEGDISQILPLTTTGLDLAFRLDSPAMLENIGEFTFVKDNPLIGSANLAVLGPAIKVDLDVVSGENDLSGKIVLESPEHNEEPGKPRIYAELKADRLDTTIMFPEDNEVNKERVFSDKPFKIEWMEKFNGYLALQANSYKNSFFDFDDQQIYASLENGHLSLVAVGQRAGGALRVSVNAHKHSEDIDVSLEADGNQIDFSALSTETTEEVHRGGHFSVSTSLRGRGASLAELAATSNGFFLLEFENSEVKMKGLELIGGDIFFGVLDLVNPFSEREEFVNVECGVLHFNIEQGVAVTPHGLALKTDKVTVLGGGTAELASERIDFVMNPKARTGFGINTNSLIQLVRVGGTFRQPEFEPDTVGLLQSGLSLGAVFATGGLSLLAQGLIAKGLIDKDAANSDVCEVAVTGRRDVDVKLREIPVEDEK